MKEKWRQLLIHLRSYQFWLWFGLIDNVLSGQYPLPDRLPGLFPDDAFNHMNFTTKCFGDLGCFYTGPPWYNPIFRPVTKVPEDNTTSNTKFMLYTRSNKDKPYDLKPTPESLKISPYDKGAPVKVLFHGYKETPTMFNGVISELLKHGSYNVINVKWPDTFPYAQAIANARLVGAYTAKLLQFIMSQTELKPEDIHVIGHSTGGQLVGFVGERIHNLGRITGLEPAGPYFRAAPKEVRLDRSDALFVDIIQTNIGESIYHGVGLDLVYGHADFRVNGGNHQPGCDYNTVLPLIGDHDPYRVPNFCSHVRSIDYFQSSINTCQYNATACFSFEGFEAGLCNDTPFTNRMGLHAVKPPYQLVYYLDTTSQAPYCESKSS